MTGFKFPTVTTTKYKTTLFTAFLFLHHSLKPFVFLPLLVGLDILIFRQILVSHVCVFVLDNTFLLRIHFGKLFSTRAESIEMLCVVISSVKHPVSPGSPEAALEGVPLRVVLVGRLRAEVVVQLRPFSFLSSRLESL